MEPPITRSINYVALFLQFIFLILLFVLFQLSSSDEAGLWAAMVYLVLAYGLRYFVPIDHRKGMRELKQGNYKKAIESFDKSLNFFSNHSWVDRYRVFTIFSASKMCYREMALVNKAFSLACIDQKEDAKILYEKCLLEYPKNSIAFYALKMME
jgi:tetratricopeptide (TPR) repeat protein